MSRAEHCCRAVALAVFVAPLSAQEHQGMQQVPGAHDHAQDEPKASQSAPEYGPALPPGMTLDQVLDRAASPPPAGFPRVIPDDELHVWTFFEQFEYRAQSRGPDEIGTEAQGWVGYDLDRLWWKLDGEVAVDDFQSGAVELDVLYSRLIAPFWNAQAGLQYADTWDGGKHEDLWSAALGIQGIAPGLFELDNTLYITERGDFTATFEGEYDIRVTQRTVLQPRSELRFAAQDVPEQALGAGLYEASLELRLRYEWRREFAPYLGVRYLGLVGETADNAAVAGEDRDQFALLLGVRWMH